MKKIVIFVCNGNIHRSVIAAQCFIGVLKNNKLGSRFIVDSYGLQGTQGTALPKHRRLSDYPKEWEAANPILQELNIDISNHRFQKITANIMKKAGVVIAMDNKVYSREKNSLKFARTVLANSQAVGAVII
jgi:protein-tyrosine-phosphatase